MGANASSTYMSVVNETMTNVSTQVLTDVANKTSAHQQTSQIIKVFVGPGGELNCGMGNLTLTQKASNAITALGTLDSSQIANLSNDIQNKFSSELASKIAQKNTGLNLGQLNVSDVNQKISNIVRTNINTVVKTTLSNSVTVDSTTRQVQSFNIYGKVNAGGCDFNQESTTKLVASNITKNINNLIQNNTAVTDAFNKADSVVSQTNTGLSLMGIFLVLLIIGAMFFIGGGQAVTKYAVPIGMIVSLAIAVVMGVKHQMVPAAIGGIAFLGLGGYKGYALLKSEKSE
jgi:hypothetical protein